MTRILILGGTREAAELAAKLVASGHAVTTSLAGRTREPKPVDGQLRVGGFGGVAGLIDYIETHRIEKLVDATHPFAKQISANARQATNATGVELESIVRQPWEKQPGDTWTEVMSLDEARDSIPVASRVLLALGSQHIALFKTRGDVFFLVRMVDEPAAPLPLPDHQLLIGKPAASAKQEAAMLSEHGITHIVCRNSGGKGAYAKIEAARDLGLPVIMVQR